MNIRFNEKLFGVFDSAKQVIRQIELARDPNSGTLYLERMPGYNPHDPDAALTERMAKESPIDETVYGWGMVGAQCTGLPGVKK